MQSEELEHKMQLAQEKVDRAKSVLEERKRIVGVDEATTWLEKCQKEWAELEKQRILMRSEARDKKAVHQFRVAFEQLGNDWQHRRDWNLKQVGELIGVEAYPTNQRVARLLNEEFGDLFTFELLDSIYTGGRYLFVAPRLIIHERTRK